MLAFLTFNLNPLTPMSDQERINLLFINYFIY